MNFMETLLEALLEGKIDDVLDKHTTIPNNVKQDYLKQIPANNAQHLDWVLNQHTKGNIKPEHNIHKTLSIFNRVKDKLPKKQINQYKSLDELHAAVLPHTDTVKQSTNEKGSKGTETLYSSPTMTIRQHHNYESAVSAANLPESNPRKEKAGWCVSVGNGGGAGHYSAYTDNGFHPIYTIEHKHPDGSSSRHMLVYDHNKTQANTELRNEADCRPGFSEYSSTRPDLLDHYGKVHSELLKTPIAKFFTESGREEYKKSAEPAHQKLKETINNIPKTGMTDEEYMANFKAGQEKQQGGIHNTLAGVPLSHTQLNHLIEHGNAGAMHDIAKRTDLTEDHIKKLANTSNMIVHHQLLQRPHLSDANFNTIVKKAHSELIDTIAQHPKFDLQHLDTAMGRGNNIDFSSFISKKANILEPEDINKLLTYGGSYKNKHALITHANSKLSDTHITNLINEDGIGVVNKLITTIPNRLDDHIDTMVKNWDNDAKNSLLVHMKDKLNKDHISSMIKHNNMFAQKNLINQAPEKLDSDHIDTLINLRDDLVTHNILTHLSDQLQPHHITSLIQNNNASTHEDILKKIPNKLDDDHISEMLAMGNESQNTLLGYKPKLLKSKHIDYIISQNSDELNKNLILSRKDIELEPHHIANLINNTNLHRAIAEYIPHKLEDGQITQLINHGDPSVHRELIHGLGDKLEPHHITNLIDNGGQHNHDILMYRLKNKLEPQHITKLIRQGNEETHEAIINKLSDKLNSTHISSLIAAGNPKVYNHLLTHMGHKLEPTHINELSNKVSEDDGISKNLSKTAKKKLDHYAIKLKYSNHKVLKEGYLLNGNFQKLLKESLISKTRL